MNFIYNNYYIWFLPKFYNSKFISEQKFLEYISSEKITKVLFLNNKSILFGILNDGSFVHHNVINQESLNLIQNSLKKTEIQFLNIKDVFNNAITNFFKIFSLALKTILVIACIAILLTILCYFLYFLIQFSQKTLEILEKVDNELNKSLGNQENFCEEFDQRLYEKNIMLDNVIFENNETKAIINNFIEKIKNNYQDLNLFSEKTIKNNSTLLLYGPPGTGKSLLGHVIANELQTEIVYINGTKFKPFYANQAPTLINNFFEQIEKEIKKNPNKKLVVMIDEADIILTKRGSDQYSDQQDQATTTFLTKIEQIIEKYSKNIILIFATNYENNIDPAIQSRIQLKIKINELSKEKKIDLIKKKFGKFNKFIENFDQIVEMLNLNNISGRDIDRFVNNIEQEINNKLNHEIQKNNSYKSIKDSNNKIQILNQEIKSINQQIKNVNKKSKKKSPLDQVLAQIEKNLEQNQPENLNTNKNTQDILDLKQSILTNKSKELQIVKNSIREKKDKIINKLNLKKKEINELKHQKEQTEEEMNNLQNRIILLDSARKQPLYDSKGFVTTILNFFAKQFIENQNLKEILQQLNEKKLNLEKKNADLDNKINNLDNEIKDLDNKINNLDNEIKDLDNKINNLDNEKIEEVNKNIESLQKESQISQLKLKLKNLEIKKQNIQENNERMIFQDEILQNKCQIKENEFKQIFDQFKKSTEIEIKNIQEQGCANQLNQSKLLQKLLNYTFKL